MIRLCLLCLCLSFISLELTAQEVFSSPRYGGSIGVTFNLGTTLRRIGLQTTAYYARDRFQWSVQNRLLYNFHTFGPPQSRPEWQLSAAMLWAYGSRDTLIPPFLHVLTNQTGRRNSLAYAYNWYVEKTSRQQSGTLALQFGNLEIITENDALAGQGQDKYRTGALQMAYRLAHSRIALQTLLWTGNTHGDKVHRIKDAGDYPCRFGYKDISQAHCGRYSHGILTLQYSQYLGLGQFASASMGIDSERVRHFFQNRLIHDMPMIPQNWVKTHNPHYPMLDTDGNPYLFQEGQQLRSPRFFFDLAANGTLFY